MAVCRTIGQTSESVYQWRCVTIPYILHTTDLETDNLFITHRFQLQSNWGHKMRLTGPFYVPWENIEFINVISRQTEVFPFISSCPTLWHSDRHQDGGRFGWTSMTVPFSPLTSDLHLQVRPFFSITVSLWLSHSCFCLSLVKPSMWPPHVHSSIKTVWRIAQEFDEGSRSREGPWTSHFKSADSSDSADKTQFRFYLTKTVWENNQCIINVQKTSERSTVADTLEETPAMSQRSDVTNSPRSTCWFILQDGLSWVWHMMVP